MSKSREDTIGGFNTFLEDQQGEPGEATVTLYDFDNSVERVYHGKSIEKAPKLDEETYTPGGQTALHDAITTAITETERRIEKLPAGVRPANVIVVALTDGKENASETPQERVANSSRTTEKNTTGNSCSSARIRTPRSPRPRWG